MEAPAEDLASLAEALRPALLRAARQLRRAALKSGVSALDEQVLHAIKLNPGIGVSELAERERMSRPSMSSHVKRLRALDWIAADADAGDGRRVGLSLSANGKTALAAIRRRRNDWLSGRLATLSESDRRALAAAAGPASQPERRALMDDAPANLAPLMEADLTAVASDGVLAASERPDVTPAVAETKPFSSLVPAIIGAALMMQTLNATVMTNALPTMARSFGEDPVRLNTAITVYLLASAVFLPISGWAADRFGAKRVFRLAICGYATACAACGFAHSLPELLIARFCAGAAGAMMVPVGRLVLLRTTPKHDLVRAMSVLTMPALLGPVLGPPIGGLIVTYGSWRWIFFLNLPIALLGVILVGRFIPNVREERTSPLDWPGLLLTGVGMASVVFGFETLGRGPLPLWAGLLLMAFGVVCLLVFARRARGDPHAILDVGLLKIPTYRAGVVGGAFMRMGMGATPFLLALMLQVAFGLSALQAGLMTFASAAAALVMKTCAPPILRRFGFKRTLAINAVIVAVTFMAYGLFRPATPHWLIYVVLLTGGFFRSLQFTSLNGIAFADIERAQMSRASTLSTMGQQLAQSIGIGLAAVLLHAFIVHAHAGHPTAATIAPVFVVIGCVALVSALFFLPLPRDAGAALHGTSARTSRLRV